VGLVSCKIKPGAACLTQSPLSGSSHVGQQKGFRFAFERMSHDTTKGN
jgi:hypothetical protein